MTGEISLRGQVLAIGGVKEKVLAAHRNGLTTVILPKRNEQDIDDVPEEIRNSMKFIFAESVEDVIDAALEKAKPVKKQAAKKQPRKPIKKKSNTTKAKKNDKAKSTARRR
jgi:ATP-dependent Lon protease